MEPSGEKRGSGRRRSGSGYGYGGSSRYGGYGYGGYGYGGYGYGGYGTGESAVQRTVQDYLLILRERIWYVVAAFLAIVVSVAIYTFTCTPVFQSVSTVEIFRRAPTVMEVQQVMDSEVRTAEDLNTQVNILKSDAIVDRVASRLTGDDRRRFLAPYLKPGHPAPSVQGILAKNREVVPERLSLIIDIEYQHPDRAIAAKVANLFADEYIAYNAHTMVDESMKAVEELEDRVDDQRKKVDAIAAALQAYREKNNSVSLDSRKDIVTEKLKDLNTDVTQNSASLQEAEIRWKAVTETKQHGGNLLDLSFIATVPAVSQLQQQVAAAKIAVAQLAQRYRAKHPQMIQAVDSLNAAETQLQHAIDIAAAQVTSDYQNALQNYAQSRAALATQEKDSLRLDRYALDYNNLERDYDVNEKLLEQILERTRETSMNSSVESQNARIVDHAVPVGKPVSPRYALNLALGVVGGLGFGMAMAFFVAYFDDRVKSAFDIESVIGLPLVGVIPEVKRLGQAEEMQDAVAKKASREVSEAFSTLLSVLKLKDETKNAQCILVTSTIASEGKTFISTNLATTFAAHGERVVVVDCDLRRPAVNRVFHLENLKGVIDVCTAGATLDEVTAKSVRPNLDVIPTGGRSKNPTHVLNSKEFALMLSELRKRYDRVFVDTPPVAIVSDALIVLPLVDGWLYSIYFNKAKRKTAEYCAKRLLEVNVPNLGAVLNGLTGGVGGYYYSHYYDKSYQQYYVTHDEQVGGEGSKIVEAPPTKRRR